MESLLYVLDGEAKRTVQSIGKTGFYMRLLKTLKRDLGNLTVVSYLKEKRCSSCLRWINKINHLLEITNNNLQQQLFDFLPWVISRL